MGFTKPWSTSKGGTRFPFSGMVWYVRFVWHGQGRGRRGRWWQMQVQIEVKVVTHGNMVIW